MQWHRTHNHPLQNWNWEWSRVSDTQTRWSATHTHAHDQKDPKQTLFVKRVCTQPSTRPLRSATGYYTAPRAAQWLRLSSFAFHRTGLSILPGKSGTWTGLSPGIVVFSSPTLQAHDTHHTQYLFIPSVHHVHIFTLFLLCNPFSIPRRFLPMRFYSQKSLTTPYFPHVIQRYLQNKTDNLRRITKSLLLSKSSKLYIFLHVWDAWMSACGGVGVPALACACECVALLIQHSTRRHTAICILSGTFFDFIS